MVSILGQLCTSLLGRNAAHQLHAVLKPQRGNAPGNLGFQRTGATELQTHDHTKAGPTQAGQRRPGAQNTGASSRPAATAAASNHPRWKMPYQPGC